VLALSDARRIDRGEALVVTPRVDLLVQCYSLAPMKTGRIAVEGGTWTDVTGVKAWGMSRG